MRCGHCEMAGDAHGNLSALVETLRDTNRLLCIVADTAIDILIAIEEPGDNQIIEDRIFKVIAQKAKLAEAGGLRQGGRPCASTHEARM